MSTPAHEQWPLVFLTRDVLEPAASFEYPDQYTVRLWRPLLDRRPSGFRPSARQVVWAILFRTLHRDPRFGILTVADERGAVVHTAAILPRYFRVRFMAKDDVMISLLLTEPSHRGAGLATSSVAYIIRWLGTLGRAGTVWYVADRSNVPSLHVASKNGFVAYAVGSRTRDRAPLPINEFVVIEKLASINPDDLAIASSGQPEFDFATVTEHWDTLANREQRDMARMRYAVAGRLAEGRRYLDVACGSGIGLAKCEIQAAFSVGGDISTANLAEARQHRGRSQFAQFDAEQLPFASDSFGAVACLEAIYYFRDARTFLLEAKRLLTCGGQVVISYPNPLRPGFTVSPGSVAYPPLRELRDTLETLGFEVAAYGAFSWQPAGAVGRALERVRRIASRVGLIPRSLDARARLKGVFYHDMSPIGDIVQTQESEPQLHRLGPTDEGTGFKILFVIATKL